MRLVNNRVRDITDDSPSLQTVGFIDVTDEELEECQRKDENVGATTKDKIELRD